MLGSTTPTTPTSSGAQISRTPSTSPDMGASTPQKFIGAVKDDWQLYSDRACDYTIGEPIGFGASSIVYAAQWKPADDPNAEPIPCALKVLDLDLLPPRSLSLLQRETTLMSLSKHPNVLRVRGSWVEGHKLFIALRLMNKGSAADVMKYGWPGGMEEEVVKCILRQALKGLNYLHVNGFIHRDIKAANMLIDDDGTVLLGDLGVAADLSEDPRHHHSSTSSASRSSKITATAALSQPRAVATLNATPSHKKPDPASRPPIGKRKSFVGTPCWMAPELIQGKQYDASADIWSFAITALELSQGHPPRFRESPQKVLLRTLQEDPPTLNRQGGTYKYTRAFKDMIDSCLVKDPSKRPTAEQLLQTPLFRSAKKKSYLVNAVLKNLPPLVQRQERRRLPSLASPNSIDSWDFATTINSPTGMGSMRRLALEEFCATSEQDEVFEMENEYTAPSAVGKRPDHTADGEPRFSSDHSEFDYGVELGAEDGDASSPEMSAQVSSNSESGISRSVTPSTSVGSPEFTSVAVSTAPSSYVASSSPVAVGKMRESNVSGKEGVAITGAAGRQSPSANKSSSCENLSQSLPQVSSVSGTIILHRRLPTTSDAAPQPDYTPSSPLTKVHSAVSDGEFRKKKDKGSRMWKKLKNNLRPSLSSAALKDSKQGDAGGEKPGMLGGLLSRTSTRATLGKNGK